MNLKLDLLGRFTYEHPVYIIAYAANAPNSNTEIVSLSFNNLNANQYFSGVGNTVTLLAEWLLPEKTGLGETPLLLHFELKESFDFDEPVSIDLASLVTPEQADGLNLKMDYTTIPNGGGSLPVTWDPQTRQAEFTPTEAGTYALLSVPLYDQRTPNDTAQEVEEPFVWEPQVDHSQVSDFTGSISYAHPVSIPPGPNGIQPPVGWVYSSAGTNGNAGALLALPYGAGWSMTQHIDIVQSLGTCQEASPEDPNSTSDSGVACEKQVQYGQNLYYTPYTLSFHGSQYELFHSSGKGSNGDPGRYHAAGDAGLYVEYCKAREGHSVSSVCVSSDDSDSNTNNGIPDEIGHRSVGFWIVKTPSNKAYRLGYTNNSEQEIRFGHTHAELDNYAYKWRVDRIQDRFSNTVTYTYDEAFKPGLNETNKWYRVQAVQSVLTQISYGDNNTYTIDFSYGNGAVAQESIAGWNTLGTLRMVHVETRSLVSIIVREDGNDVHVYRPKYVWEQYGTNDAQTPPTPGPVSQSQSTECADHAFGSERQDVHPRNIGILVEIQDLGSALQGRTETYDVRFGYTFYLTARKRLGYRSGTTDLRYCAPIMTEMTTLYGPLNQPTAEYAVREMGLEANSYGDSSDGLYFIKYDMGEFESDGDEIKDRTYSFYNTVTSQTEHSGNTLNAPDIVTYYEYNLPQHLGQDNSFQGFADVRKCEGGSCTGNWLRKNYFDFAAYDWTASDSTLTGKLTRHVIDDSVGGRNYRLDNTYDVLSNQVSGVPTDTRHPILITQVEYDKRNGGNVDTQTQFEYDMYGNQTIIKEYGGNGSVRRTTETNYVYNANSDNTGRWLVNLPWQTTLWDNEDNPFTILSRVRSRYDGAACGDQTGYVPTNGLLTNKDVYIPGGGSGECDANHITTGYSYGGLFGGDWWQLTRIDGPSGSDMWETFFWSNSSQLYSRTNAIGATTYTYDSTFPWLIGSITQPNGASTEYTYDSFGRLTKTMIPNSTNGIANQFGVRYTYHEADYPLHIDTITFLNGTDVADNITERTFYDALGRPLQKRTWGHNEDVSTNSIFYIAYDSLGRQICQTTPFIGQPSYEYNPDFNCTNSFSTLTEYDGMNAVTKVTDPAGMDTVTFYFERTQTVTDAEGNSTIFTNDDLGRLVSVKDANNEITNYTYDLANNLRFVDTPDNSQTEMRYDKLNRKTYMDDPDMGVWTYDYDVAGNLARQTDANNQRLCFYYDGLSRPTETRYDGTGASDCPASPNGTTLAEYTYHLSGVGVGLLHTTTYNSGDIDTFDYDYRGRVTQQSRMINGQTFTSTISYDNLDRVLTQTYPNGEAITTGYAGQFADTLFSALEGDHLIEDMNYNVRGQLSKLVRHNVVGSLDTKWNYHSASNNFRLRDIVHGSWLIDELPDHQYLSYDRLGNFKEIRTLYDSEMDIQTFIYDDLYRLVDAQSSLQFEWAPSYHDQYSYNELGNIDSRTVDGEVWGYTYDVEHPHAVATIIRSQGGNLSYEYDDNGNMIERTENGVVYDQEFDVQNRLTKVTVNSQNETQFFYDASGQRILTIQPDGTYIYTPFAGYEEEHIPSNRQTINISRPTRGETPVDDSLSQSQTPSPPATDIRGRSHDRIDNSRRMSSNLLINGDFESSTTGWGFFGSGYWFNSTPGTGDSPPTAAQVEVTGYSSNQFMQNGITLQPNTDYQLSFDAKGNYGQTIEIHLLKDGSPYTNYGLNTSETLSSSWSHHVIDFTTGGFSTQVDDARFRFWFSNLGTYHFDNIVLSEASGSATATPIVTATNTPIVTATEPGATPTNTPIATSTPTATATNNPPGNSDAIHRYNLDDGQGIIAEDSAGNADGTLYGPTWTTGYRGGALDFDGEDDYVDLGDVDIVSSNNTMTIAFWFKADDFDVSDARFISKAIGDQNDHHDWMVSTLNYRKLRFRLRTDSTTTSLETVDGIVTTNKWTHVAAVYDGNKMYIYIDGDEEESTPKTGDITNRDGNVALGNQPYGTGSRPFDGLMDEICLYDKALSATEISAIMANGCVASTSPTPTPTNTPTPTTEVTKIQRTYYSIAGQSVGVRTKKILSNGSTEFDKLYYMYTDHLGSVGALSDANGVYVTDSLTLYRPFGEYRRTTSTNPTITDRGFTGHKHNTYIKLIDMNARWYLPEIGRFISPDTIVPDPTNPQSLNRYSYVVNRPLVLSDPTGHIPCFGGNNPSECSWSGTNHHAVPTAGRQQDLANYTTFLLAEVRNPDAGITDVEVMARMMNFAAGFNTGTQDWANDITSVVNGTTGLFTLLTAVPGDQAPQFGDIGFHPVYQDEQNQIYHWWAFVNTAVQGGQIGANLIGYVGNEVHEFWDPREAFRQPASGSSWQDYALSENGMSFGLSLYYGYTTPDNAANVTRSMLTTDNRRPAVRWMANNVSNNWLPPNILRSLITAFQ